LCSAEGDAFKKFCLKLCGKAVCHDLRSQASYRKRKGVQNDTINKRLCNDITPMDTDSSLQSINGISTTIESDVSTISDVVINSDNYTTKNVVTYTLADSWKTVDIHARGINGRGVTIAFLDSGINIMHKSLVGRIKAVNDITCSGDIDLTTDSYGHGTMSAFIACGKSFQPLASRDRVSAGVAPEASIVMYKITNRIGQVRPEMITKGLQMCLADKERYGIDIVVLPFGSTRHDPIQGQVIRKLIVSGVHVITASGNRGSLEGIPYPARLGCTICVGAHDKYGKTTSCTGEGDALDFTAPGEDITVASSSHPTGFQTVQGTACASACVAGLLALIIQHARSRAKSFKRLPVGASSVEQLVHNQDVIKKVLQEISNCPTRHEHSHGHGNLNPFVLFSDKTKLLEYLYKDVSF